MAFNIAMHHLHYLNVSYPGSCGLCSPNTGGKISHSLLIRQAQKVYSKKSKGCVSKLDLASNSSQPQGGFPDGALLSEATWVTQLVNSSE